jgi:transcriptional regulator with XRE-family HTH domain
VARKSKRISFGQVIRARRRALDLTQEEVARGIGTSIPYIGHLESGKRHPSQKIVVKLADILGLDRGDLFLRANPQAEAIILPKAEAKPALAWDRFEREASQYGVHNITRSELDILRRVSMMGEVRSPRDFVFILATIRHALGR